MRTMQEISLKKQIVNILLVDDTYSNLDTLKIFFLKYSN